MVACEGWGAGERHDTRVVLGLGRAVNVLEGGGDGAVVQNHLEAGDDVVEGVAGAGCAGHGHDVARGGGEGDVGRADGEVGPGGVLNRVRQADDGARAADGCGGAVVDGHEHAGPQIVGAFNRTGRDESGVHGRRSGHGGAESSEGTGAVEESVDIDVFDGVDGGHLEVEGEGARIGHGIGARGVEGRAGDLDGLLEGEKVDEGRGQVLTGAGDEIAAVANPVEGGVRRHVSRDFHTAVRDGDALAVGVAVPKYRGAVELLGDAGVKVNLRERLGCGQVERGHRELLATGGFQRLYERID